VNRALAAATAALLRDGVGAACAAAAAAKRHLLSGAAAVDELTLGAFLWRVDHGDLARLGAPAPRSADDANALRQPHVALAARRAAKGAVYRLGEFVESAPPACASRFFRAHVAS